MISGAGTGPTIPYPLKPKNYEDLIPTDLIAPRFLVLVHLPADYKGWVAMKPEQTILRHCAFWLSLCGRPPSPNTSSVTVHVPRANVFDVLALTKMMTAMNAGEST